MALAFPFLTAYDPPGTSEGTLDPLGLYQIADQLAVQLVPAVRERMQRIRFLTAMAVGAFVTENLAEDSRFRDAAPCLIWEWLLVQALISSASDDSALWGVPGTLVARRAKSERGYLDATSYLKTPRIFGFHGVYKRLAVHLGVLTVDLQPGRNAEELANAWAQDRGFQGLRGARADLELWTAAVRRALAESPPSTRRGLTEAQLGDLAQAFDPAQCKLRERRCLQKLLLSAEGSTRGALPAIWDLQSNFEDEEFAEERLHRELARRQPAFVPLLDAIRCYEIFARKLLDAFDVLRAEAGAMDVQGYEVTRIVGDKDFVACAKGTEKAFRAASEALARLGGAGAQLPSLFKNRFQTFAESLSPSALAQTLLDHHVSVQKGKGNKRPWFDALGGGRLFIRMAYRQQRRSLQAGRYVHDYRGWPIRRFRADLS